MSAAVTTETTIVETTPDALALATRELEPAEALVLRADIADFLGRVAVLRERAKGIKVTARGQEAEERMARVTRLALRTERVEGIKRCKELKASSLRRGRALDGVAAVIREMIEPVEEYLLAQETYSERADAARKDALRDARSEALRALGVDPAVYAGLGEMTEETWATILDSARDARDAKVEEAKRQEAIRVEAERLEAEARAAAKAAAVKAEAERLERERATAEENARLQAEKAALEEAARVERARVDAERAAERAKAKADADAKDLAIRTERAEAQAREDIARRERDAALLAAQEETNRAARELAAVKAAAAQAKEEAEQATREREAADAARAEAEAKSKAPTKAKYALLVATLTHIAAWNDDIESCDEPHAAARAREALAAVGLGQ